MVTLDSIPNDVMDVYNKATPINNNMKVFVQANDFKKVIKLTKFVAAKTRTYDEVKTLFGFTLRQAYLYASACVYLGLVYPKQKEGQIKLHVTKRGREFARLKWKDRNLYLKSLEYMLENDCFYQVFEIIIYNKSMPGTAQTREIMRNLGVCKSGVIKRRSSTVLSWYRYVLSEL